MASITNSIKSGANMIRSRLLGPNQLSSSSSDTPNQPDNRQDRDEQDRTQDLLSARSASQQFLQDNYWSRWATVYQNYLCEEDPRQDFNDPNEIDPNQSAVGMPDTWGIVRRFVSRVTAQPPSHRFIATDLEVADRVTRAQMWQWDKGRIGDTDKRHVTQAKLFGVSVRPWYWASEEALRKRRINPLSPPNEACAQHMVEQYDAHFRRYMSDQGVEPESVAMMDELQRGQITQYLAARLLADVGKGNLVPVEYMHKHYEGPRCDFLFIGDTYFPPNYLGMNTETRGLIVERRRTKDYFRNLLRIYGPNDNGQFLPFQSPDQHAKLKRAIQLLFETHPNGSARTSINLYADGSSFRNYLLTVVDQTDSELTTTAPVGADSLEWTVTERHLPASAGKPARIQLLAENSIWLGEFPYPYDLEGRIAFTELVFVDNLLNGLGDSVPMVIRGLNKLHNRQANQREDLVYDLLRPLVVTTDRQLYDNPELLRRGPGLRLIYSQGGPGALQPVNEGAAMASAIQSLADESALQRMLQVASGESNLSMSADVDPQQARTATGAKIQARSADILTRDMVGQYTKSVREDLHMMWLLNRSELSDNIPVNVNQYRRSFDGIPAPANPDPNAIITATPEDFQYDGEIEVEVGSTLADDDDTKLTRAQQLFQLAMSAPHLIDQNKATEGLLIAYGKGKELGKWKPAPPPPAEEPTKKSASVTYSLDKASPEEKAILLQEFYRITPDRLEAIRAGKDLRQEQANQQQQAAQAQKQEPSGQSGGPGGPGGMPGMQGVPSAPNGAPTLGPVPGQLPRMTGAPNNQQPISPNGLDPRQQATTLSGRL